MPKATWSRDIPAGDPPYKAMYNEEVAKRIALLERSESRLDIIVSSINLLNQKAQQLTAEVRDYKKSTDHDLKQAMAALNNRLLENGNGDEARDQQTAEAKSADEGRDLREPRIERRDEEGFSHDE